MAQPNGSVQQPAVQENRGIMNWLYPSGKHSYTDLRISAVGLFVLGLTLATIVTAGALAFSQGNVQDIQSLAATIFFAAVGVLVLYGLYRASVYCKKKPEEKKEGEQAPQGGAVPPAGSNPAGEGTGSANNQQPQQPVPSAPPAAAAAPVPPAGQAPAQPAQPAAAPVPPVLPPRPAAAQ